MAEVGEGTREVLIIDEEGDFTRALGIYLSDLGLHTLMASHWTDAIDRILQDTLDAILINPHLSTVKGETILGFLQQEGKLSPVLVVADHLEPERVEALKSLGAKGFVQKTDAFYQIAQALSRVLPGFSAQGAPIITDEEFERIMVQRLAEVVEENYSRSPNVGGSPSPGRSPIDRLPPVPSKEAYEPDRSGKDAVPGAAGEGWSHVALPPPPPIQQEERPTRRRGGSRRRRRGGGAGFKRLFLALFVICLLVGVVFWFTSQEVRDFVKKGEPPPGQKKR